MHAGYLMIETVIGVIGAATGWTAVLHYNPSTLSHPIYRAGYLESNDSTLTTWVSTNQEPLIPDGDGDIRQLATDSS